MKTRSGLPKHCSWNLDRKGGKRRVRFRKNGLSTYLTGTPWTEDFMRAYGAALHGVKEQGANIGANRTQTGSIDALIVSYYKLVLPRLKASTQAVRRNILERFREEHGKKPLARLEYAHVDRIIARLADKPHAANNLLKVLRHLLAHAIDLKLIVVNPAASVKKYKTSGDGIHTWTEAEVAKYTERHPFGTKAHLAMILMLCTGQRRSDAVRMGWQHVRNGMIAVRQEKTDTPLLIPIAPELEKALALTPRTNLTFLLTSRGAPFTTAGFGNWMRARCDEAGLPQCSSHGLRKLTATRLAELGCTEHEIMAITGHRSSAEVRRYTRAAEQAKLARNAMRKLSRQEQTVDENLSSIPTPLDKTRAK